MLSADRCKELAAACSEIARQATDPHDKALLLEMAETLRRFAEKASR
jgi:hypothetical protein